MNLFLSGQEFDLSLGLLLLPKGLPKELRNLAGPRGVRRARGHAARFEDFRGHGMLNETFTSTTELVYEPGESSTFSSIATKWAFSSITGYGPDSCQQPGQFNRLKSGAAISAYMG